MKRFCGALALAAFCSVAAAGSWFEDQALEHDGLARRYRYYVPDPLPANPALVFVLHGGGGDMVSVMGNGAQAEWPEIADEHGILLIAPNGVNWETGDPAGADQHWNDCRGDATISETGQDDVGYLSALIDWAIGAFAVDPQRVYSTGASNGGMMSFRLAFELSDRIAAIGPYIANLPAVTDCKRPVQPVPVLICNGDAETNYMPWDGGCVVANQGCDRGTVVSALDTRDFWIRFNGTASSPSETFDFPDLDPADGSTVTRTLYDGGYRGSEVHFYRVFGGGHTTPSIEHRRDPLVLLLLGLGNQNHDVEGAREVWDFFQRHPLDGTPPASNDPGESPWLHVDKTAGQLELRWSRDCGAADRYGIYRGDLNAGYGSLTLEPGACDVTDTSRMLPIGNGDADFFLVVPNDGVGEGGYGDGRSAATTSCYPQLAVDVCGQ